MPVYEYCCPNCGLKFELLRPASRADEKALCERCQTESRRALSTFASLSKNSSGVSTPIGGGGPSCGGCHSNCATCH